MGVHVDGFVFCGGAEEARTHESGSKPIPLSFQRFKISVWLLSLRSVPCPREVVNERDGSPRGDG